MSRKGREWGGKKKQHPNYRGHWETQGRHGDVAEVILPYACTDLDAAWRQRGRPQQNQNGRTARRLCVSQVRGSPHLHPERQCDLSDEREELGGTGQEDPECDREKIWISPGSHAAHDRRNESS